MILGTGELYLDCVMHDLRHVYADIEVKVSDPVVSLCETVLRRRPWGAPSRPTAIQADDDRGAAGEGAGGGDRGGGSTCAGTAASATSSPSASSGTCCRSLRLGLWSGRARGCVLVDDTLPSEVDKKLVGRVREYIVRGFGWASREALCDSPCATSSSASWTPSSPPAAPRRRADHPDGGARLLGLLMATPRLMEPVYVVKIVAPPTASPRSTTSSAAPRPRHLRGARRARRCTCCRPTCGDRLVWLRDGPARTRRGRRWRCPPLTTSRWCRATRQEHPAAPARAPARPHLARVYGQGSGARAFRGRDHLQILRRPDAARAAAGRRGERRDQLL